MTGGVVLASNSVPVGVVAVLALGAAVVYSVRVAYTVVEGYRTADSSRVIYIAAGLLLLTTAPILLRFVLATVVSLPAYVISGLTGLGELLGLGAILYVIYFPRGGDRQ